MTEIYPIKEWSNVRIMAAWLSLPAKVGPYWGGSLLFKNRIVKINSKTFEGAFKNNILGTGVDFMKPFRPELTDKTVI
jgi:hypothetical protein